MLVWLQGWDKGHNTESGGLSRQNLCTPLGAVYISFQTQVLCCMLTDVSTPEAKTIFSETCEFFNSSRVKAWLINIHVVMWLDTQGRLQNNISIALLIFMSLWFICILPLLLPLTCCSLIGCFDNFLLLTCNVTIIQKVLAKFQTLKWLRWSCKCDDNVLCHIYGEPKILWKMQLF